MINAFQEVLFDVALFPEQCCLFSVGAVITLCFLLDDVACQEFVLHTFSTSIFDPYLTGRSSFIFKKKPIPKPTKAHIHQLLLLELISSFYLRNSSKVCRIRSGFLEMSVNLLPSTHPLRRNESKRHIPIQRTIVRNIIICK